MLVKQLWFVLSSVLQTFRFHKTFCLSFLLLEIILMIVHFLSFSGVVSLSSWYFYKGEENRLMHKRQERREKQANKNNKMIITIIILFEVLFNRRTPTFFCVVPF